MAQKKTAAQKVKRMAEISALHKRQCKRSHEAIRKADKLSAESNKIFASLSLADRELYSEKIEKYIML